MRLRFGQLCLAMHGALVALAACTPNWATHNTDAGVEAVESDGDGGEEDAAQVGSDASQMPEEAGAPDGRDGASLEPEPDGGEDAGGQESVVPDAGDGGVEAGCGSGYRAKGSACEDIDECFEGSDACHMTATCENNAGGYDCTCPLGYSGGTSAGFACAPRVVAGERFACALLNDGRVKCWGNNDYGQLGDGTQLSRLKPVFVKGLDQIVAIAAHDSRSACALRKDGRVLCWGDNTYAQLGDGSTLSRAEATEISTLTEVVAVSVRDRIACAVVKDGALLCWGTRGGSGEPVASGTPTAFSGIPAMASVEAGWLGAGCAVTTVGAVWCWEGSGSSGPSQVPGIKNVIRVGTGTAVCAMLANARMQCWGPDPARSTGDALENIVSMSMGLEITHIVQGDGKVYQWWGLPDYTTGKYAYTTVPIDAVVVAGGGAGSPFACAVVRDGTVRCWGSNTTGQLGDGTSVSPEVDLTNKVYDVTTVSGLDLW